jgi:serine protease AprX
MDANGAGTYLDVIRAINWVVANKDTYAIRVLNLSFSTTPRSYYWDDPLNQAVMAAWEAGIVVVASAGNTGPDAQSIGVPGNVPYIITVGAMSDDYTPEDGADDVLASFSAAGPTYEGFVKPVIVSSVFFRTGEACSGSGHTRALAAGTISVMRSSTIKINQAANQG